VTLEEALDAAIFADSQPVSDTLARWKPFILTAERVGKAWEIGKTAPSVEALTFLREAYRAVSQESK
jgi:hypothetical protein